VGNWQGRSSQMGRPKHGQKIGKGGKGRDRISKQTDEGGTQEEGKEMSKSKMKGKRRGQHDAANSYRGEELNYARNSGKKEERRGGLPLRARDRAGQGVENGHRRNNNDQQNERKKDRRECRAESVGGDKAGQRR